MKKKTIYRTLAIITLFVLIAVLAKKRETDFYIGLTGPPEYGYTGIVDIKVELDGQLIFNDTVYYHPYGYHNVKEKLRIGFHRIKVSSTKADLITEKTVFLFFNQHITIEFYESLATIRDKPLFDIWVNWNPFYYE